MIAAVLISLLAALPCNGRVELEGDRALIRGVGEELRGRGIETPGDGSCPAHRARVVRAKQGIVLTLADPEGRTVERTVRDPSLIASWIESRIRTDLAEPLLSLPELPAQEPPPVDAAPVVAEPVVAEPVVAEAQVAEPASPAAAVLAEERDAVAPSSGGPEISASGELGLAGGTTTEYGVAASAALPLGSFVEPTLTVRASTSERFETNGLSPARRRSGELLVGARLPLQLAFVRLVPGVGVGAGIDATSRESCAGCGPVVADDARVSTTAMRVEASLGAGAQLARDFALDVALSAGASPFAGSDPSLPSWAEGSGTRAAYLALPAAPSWRVRAGLGLSWRGW